MSRIKKMLKSLDTWLIVLSLIVFLLKLAIISEPWPKLEPKDCRDPPFPTECAFIFDEAHYVPAARKMMEGMAVNNEHPPLSKVLIILGILIFGDNPVGWRIFMVLSGAISVYLVGKLSYLLLGNQNLAFISATLFAFDITSFNLSSMAILDPPALALSMFSAILFLKKRYVYSGVFMGLALLSKISSIFILLALLFFQLIREAYLKPKLIDALRNFMVVLEKSLIISVLVLVAGLAVYDYAYNVFSTPFGHIDYILNYHTILTFKEGDTVHMPLSWTNPFLQYPRESYYVVTVTENGKTYHPVAYYSMQTPLWWMTWLIVAFMLYLSYINLENRVFPEIEIFTLSWISFTYFIYFPLAYLMHRWVYPFYFYQTVPIIAVGITYILSEDKFSKLILYVLTALQIAWFIVWFPVKPQWLIDLLLLLNLPA
ncbi:MAG: glycosyltransferase family 39 protein [Nitrososphaerota archaeon]